MTPAPATTLLLLRPEPDGFSVFLVRRHGRAGFLPSAWVFPGGRVDAGDRLAGHPGVRGGLALGLPHDDAVAYGIAGVRETFEEAGIWLGEGAPSAATRAPLASGALELSSLLDAGARIDLDRLRPWAWWITPKAEPRRFDTRFLVALAPGAEGVHDGGETVESGWFRPSDALTLPMAPPTWWTLRELAGFATAEAAFAAPRPLRAIEPILTLEDGALELRLPGHPDHAEPEIEGLPPLIRFAHGRWWAGPPSPTDVDLRR